MAYIPRVRDMVKIIDGPKLFKNKTAIVRSVYSAGSEARLEIDFPGAPITTILKWKQIQPI
jgi:transcription antitermination factor NusG